MYVPGAISLMIDGSEVLGTDLWDDVNWLWPFVVRAFDECRRKGVGRRGFPDQPITFKVEKVWKGNLLLTVTDGALINRVAVASGGELYEAVGRAALDFFDDFQRLCPGGDGGGEEREIAASWLA
ncbi:hypothetical protein [Pseudofrankia sp. DC12]|uniref:hypothetical protein n=1 Tax=Pseudofrankia sp. DC12 TaxID=683315 RepID=UPI0012FC8805|nr:hypothetical protein [Pseudofrankia sp. DC12]